MKKAFDTVKLCLLAFMAAVAITACSDDNEPKPRKIVLTEAGTLRAALGDQLKTIESLAVEGPMDFSDFATIREACRRGGKLRYVDLGKARPEDHEIPDAAFRPIEINDIVPNSDEPNRGQFSITTTFSMIILPETINRIGSGAFEYCRVDNIRFTASVRTIDDGAFNYCDMSQCNQLTLPEGLTTIGEDCFACTKAKCIVLPSSLNAIGDCALWTQAPTEVYCLAKEPPTCNGKYLTYADDGVKLYVPVGCKAKYAAAPGWKDFATIVETTDFPKAK